MGCRHPNHFGKRVFRFTVRCQPFYHLLHQLGYSYLRPHPRPRPRKADPEAQVEFQCQLTQHFEEIARLPQDRQLRVYFQDEVRFGQQGTLTNVWAPEGSLPTAVRQTEYDYLWGLVAVCPKNPNLMKTICNAPYFKREISN